MEETFKAFGYSKRNGEVMLRCRNDVENCVQDLLNTGNTDVLMFEAPQPMTKSQGSKWLAESLVNGHLKPL